MLSRAAAIVGAVACGAAALAGCSSSSHGATHGSVHVNFQAGNGVGVIIANGRPSTLQAGDVRSAGQKITITKVEPVVTAGSMTVTDWGTRLINPAHPGRDPIAGRFSVSSLPGFTQDAFVGHCEKSAQTELDITTVASSPVAVSSAFTVHYKIGSSENTFTVPLENSMCVAASANDSRC